VGDMFSSEISLGCLNEDYQSFAIESESLRETQEDIELWTTGNVSLPKPDQPSLVEETYVCYGMVSRLYV
jgi:hypothetical protein